MQTLPIFCRRDSGPPLRAVPRSYFW